MQPGTVTSRLVNEPAARTWPETKWSRFSQADPILQEIRGEPSQTIDQVCAAALTSLDRHHIDTCIPTAAGKKCANEYKTDFTPGY
jgi:hypothetical protein